MKKILLTLLALTSSISAYAANTDTSVDVTSNILEVEKEKGTAIFIGNVKALYQDVTLRSDRLRILYDENSKSDNKIKSLVATKDVVLTQGLDKVTADYAEYDLSTDNVTFKHNVVLNRNGNLLKGDKLIMNTVTKKAKMTSDKSKRVQAVYFSDKGDQKKGK